jgi:uncharacterized small protein (DUF1192 family)
MFCSILTIALPTSIIGSNFLTEWQIHQRVQLQKKMQRRQQRKLEQQQHDGDSLRMTLSKKAEDMKIISEQNSLMLNSIAEIQERLNDINPPHYYAKYKEILGKYEQARLKIAFLEEEIFRLKRSNGNDNNEGHSHGRLATTLNAWLDSVTTQKRAAERLTVHTNEDNAEEPVSSAVAGKRSVVEWLRKTGPARKLHKSAKNPQNFGARNMRRSASLDSGTLQQCELDETLLISMPEQQTIQRQQSDETRGDFIEDSSAGDIVISQQRRSVDTVRRRSHTLPSKE